MEPIELSLARWVDQKHVGLRLGTNLWVGVLPDSEEEDEQVMVSTPYDGHAGLEVGVDPHSPYDTFFIQVQSRGKSLLSLDGSDVLSGRQNAVTVYHILHMLDLGTVERAQPEATGGICNLVACEADGPPRLIELEGDRQRPIWGNNYRVQVRSPGGLRDPER